MIYPVEQFYIRLNSDFIDDPESMKDSWKKMIEGYGWSWVSEPEIKEDYNIDEDILQRYVVGRYIRFKGRSGMILFESMNSVEII